jgi:hypothetical protein
MGTARFTDVDVVFGSLSRGGNEYVLEKSPPVEMIDECVGPMRPWAVLTLEQSILR